jgi:hypothetical protein
MLKQNYLTKKKMPKKLTEEEKIIKSKISTKKLTDNFQVSIEKAGE